MSTITLPNIRVSSDLTVKLKLKDGGVALDWSTLTNIKVSIYSDAQRALAGRCSVAIDAEDSTLLVCTYAANKPQYVGVNRVVVSAKYMNETKTYDKPAFNFVRWTDDQEGQTITIDDPDIDVEISVEDVSSSILQEAVDAANTAAERANEAAEAAEHMVDIHTGPAGKSPYIGENGHWYEWDEETDQYVDTETNAKGDTGETPDITIGTVTTAEPGTPAAATMTGTPEDPVLNLTIPKGAVGATPNFTIGTVTTGEPGTPVVVTLTGTPEAPVLNITIPQGMQGNTGSSVDYPYELVNNLTTNDATKGLSAQQGKVLKDELSQLEHEVNPLSKDTYRNEAVDLSDYPYRRYSLQDTGNYNTNNTYKHKLIPVKAGDRYIVVSNPSYEARVAFLSESVVATSGATAPLVAGTSVMHQPAGATSTYTIPVGAKYLYIYCGQESSYTYTPSSVTRIYNANVKELDDVLDDIAVTNWNEVPYYSATGAKLVSSGLSSYANYPYFVLPMVGGVRYKLEWTGATSDTNYAVSSIYPDLDVPVSDFATSSKASDSIEFNPVADCFLVLSNLHSYTSLKAYSFNNSIGGVVNEMIERPSVRTLSIAMEIGTISSDGADNNSFDYASIRQRSQVFLGFNLGDIITEFELDEGESVGVACYDSAFNRIDTTFYGIADELPKTTSWVRFRITNNNGFDTLRNRVVTMNKRGEVRFAKCSGTTGGANNYIIFDVEVPADEGNTFATSIRTFDKGVIKLPYNYSRDGKPTPLVLWCHGTGGFLFDSSGVAHGNLLQFFCKNGYAVADCTGITAYFGLSSSDHYVSGLEDSKNNPLLLACYGALLNYIGRKYNIDTTNVYVLAKSAGGLVATQLGYNANFRVRAIANLAPALCQVGQSFRVTGLTPMKFWLERFGIDTTGYDEMSQQERLALIESHLSAFVGFDPLFEGTGIDFASAVHQMFTHDDVSGATNIGNAYANDDVLMAMFDYAKKYQPVPMKIWHAPDDTSVPILWSQKYKEMVGRGNGICYLREMPTGTGGHYSVDEGNNAPKTNYLCDNGEVVEITIAYAEALQWFRKW